MDSDESVEVTQAGATLAQNVNRILVVDDEPEVAAVLVRALKLSGYDAVAEFDGQAAFERIEGERFDVLLTDLQMPRLRGDDLQKMVQAAYPDIVTIVVTAAHDTHVAVDCLKAGAYDYILKPFDLHDVAIRMKKAIERRDITRELHDYQANLQRKVAEQAGRLRNMLLQSMEALTNALEAKDEATRDHSLRAAHHAVRMAAAIAPTDYDFHQKIRLAAMLHDIGKIGVSDVVLRKPARLTYAEYEAIKLHVDVGESILRPLFEDDPTILSIVRHHHERWDGTGYPDGLSGADIPVGARILAICDAYDAMISTRPYRPGMESAEALRILKSGADTQWDGHLVGVFIALYTQA
ncbi:MAG TPA: HD domain-containing phosphohydrolase [Capsulimonadaceae bacterium]|jgi:putative nucleotidyltransferase with HDIG domain